MNEIDMNKLDVAIKYIRRMSEGKNPVNNQLAEDNVLENVNVVRCLYFVADVLEQVRQNGGVISNKKKEKRAKKEKFSYVILEEFQYRNDKPISHLVKQMNEPVEVDKMQKLSYKSIKKALIEEGYLQEQFDAQQQQNIMMPTQKGKEIGMYVERKTSTSGNTYSIVMYDKQAQLFLKENLEQLLMNED